MDTRRPARWADQPPAARVALLVVLLGSTVLLVWNLARGGDAPFYAAAARSMSGSWHALWSGSFDPSGTVTLDKLSGFLVPQALSIRLFGDSTSALALPQVVEGLVTVWACSVIGLRWAGAGTGLVAALGAATTPIFVSMFAHPMEDGLLTAALAVALLCWQRAAITGSWWSLVLSGIAVGAGFQAKMLQAWFVLPALLLGTMLADARPGGRRWNAWVRLGRTAALGAVAVAASLVWVVWLAHTPVGARPYVDGSTDDDPWAMVFGYNGLDRFRAGAFPGAVSVHPSATPGPSGDPGRLTKLLEPHLGSQVSWLLPAALFAVVVGVVVLCVRRRDRSARVFGGAFDSRAGAVTLVVVTVWLATAAAVLSVARIPHTAYVAAVGVQLAVLAAVGWCGAVGLARSRSAWLRALPLVLAVGQEAWWLYLAHGAGEPTVLAHTAHVVANATVVAAVVALLWRPRDVVGGPSGPHRASRAAIAATTGLALVAGPAAFSVQALDAARDGSGLDASVGRTVGAERYHVSTPDWRGGEPAPYPPAVQQLVALAGRIDGHRAGTPLFLTDAWRLSSLVVSATGLPVLTDGGFSGAVPVFTTRQIRERIDHGLRVLVSISGARADDPVLRAALAGGCRTVPDARPGHRVVLSTWPADDLQWTVWRCGLPGPSTGRVLVRPAHGDGPVRAWVRPARAPRAGTAVADR
ncbi:ArnT family glycosyltransferase [Curtobacterium luteum]|uniref:ArnT family glycosyltransferase n=1 Tax=Curtobacterium luteum TaxID=33881 RepID=UPI000736A265|nr:glycosyltransferase family 39 protein [Curtobacterium luteum]